SYPEIRDWAERTNSFAGVSIQDAAPYNLADEAGSEQVTGEMVSPDYFTVLELRPHVGRVLDESDEAAGGAPVALISHALWQRRYAGTRDILGQVVRIDGTSAAVVGVLPPGFRGLSTETDLWVTL